MSNQRYNINMRWLCELCGSICDSTQNNRTKYATLRNSDETGMHRRCVDNMFRWIFISAHTDTIDDKRKVLKHWAMEEHVWVVLTKQLGFFFFIAEIRKWHREKWFVVENKCLSHAIDIVYDVTTRCVVMAPTLAGHFSFGQIAKTVAEHRNEYKLQTQKWYCHQRCCTEYICISDRQKLFEQLLLLHDRDLERNWCWP